MCHEDQEQPFPLERPSVRIEPAGFAPFAVDCRELRWWFAPPELGRQTSWAAYERGRDDPRWRLTEVTRMKPVGPATIHQVAGVEIEVDEWRDGRWHPCACLVYGRLTCDSVQWLAYLRRRNGGSTLETFLDADFAANWGESSRRIGAGTRFVEKSPGVLTQMGSEPAEAGLGFHTVALGETAHECLRVLDLRGVPSEVGVLVEAYVNREGRTVLFRRYNGRLWGGAGAREWDQALPHHEVITVDGVKYVHWYDCLTDASLTTPVRTR